jgi:hypothetical protein
VVLKTLATRSDATDELIAKLIKRIEELERERETLR